MIEQLQAVMLALGIVALLTIASTAEVRATTDFEGLGRGIDQSIKTFQQGDDDGEDQGEDDYPNFDSRCPNGGGAAYCAGWLVGYNRGFNAAETVNN